MFKREAEAALRSTLRDLQGQDLSMGNYSLCHGIAGNAELFIYGSEVLGSTFYRQFAEHLGLQGIRLYGGRGGHWPSGMMGSPEAPNLMLGLAGTGYFYLRLYDPETPSIFILPWTSASLRIDSRPANSRRMSAVA